MQPRRFQENLKGHVININNKKNLKGHVININNKKKRPQDLYQKKDLGVVPLTLTTEDLSNSQL